MSNQISINYLITGIPRSGTSLLARLMDDQTDSVVINEPQEVFSLLASASSSERFPRFYDELRKKITGKIPIENKIRNGKVVNDTAMGQKRAFYCPVVETSSFLLGTKNTVAYLCRLEILRNLMGGPIFACIRDPRATIASWKRSFEHLRNANVRAFPVGGLPDTMLSAAHRVELKKMIECKDLRIRRALLWRYLANRLLKHRSLVEIVRYEALTSNTGDVLRGLLRLLRPAYVTAVIPSDINIRDRNYADGLEQEELDIVVDICSSAAEALGYQL